MAMAASTMTMEGDGCEGVNMAAGNNRPFRCARVGSASSISEITFAMSSRFAKVLIGLSVALPLADALVVHAPLARGSIACSRASPLRLEEAEEATPEPAAEAAPPPSEPAKSDYAQPQTFLGLDTASPSGALIASLLVSGGFGLAVEFVKFVDPNNAGDASIFGSLSTIGT